MTHSTRYQIKFALVIVAVAAGLFVVSKFLPPSNLQTFVWSAAISLLFFLAVAAIEQLLRKREPITPEQARQNVEARRRWIVLPFPLGVALALVFYFLSKVPAYDYIDGLILGICAGPAIFVLLFFAPAFLQRGNQRPIERKFPLEAERRDQV